METNIVSFNDRKVRAKLVGKGLVKPIPVVGIKQLGSISAIRARQLELGKVQQVVVSFVS